MAKIKMAAAVEATKANNNGDSAPDAPKGGSYVIVEGQSMVIDSPEQEQAAREAIADAGLSWALVYLGAPDCPNSYEHKGHVLGAAKRD